MCTSPPARLPHSPPVKESLCFRVLTRSSQILQSVRSPQEAIITGDPRTCIEGLLIGLMVGEKKAISRGFFRYNGPCGCQDGHCAVRKSVIYIYSIYISAPPSNRPLEHLFVVQPSYARPTHAHVRIGVWYHPHGACRGFWLSIFGTRLFWPSLQCAPKPMKLVHRCHLRGWFRG